ncbi:MAG TPA: 4-hydroxy-3-methylbut-2-enyl diphosphate reductase, partial [Niastella sp.]
ATDLQRIGVVNQTTQLATDTQAIAEYLKQTIQQHYGLTPENVETRFADTRDTLCYATNDNQTAVTGMLQTPADIAIVVGGYNSSNTTHLAELCELQLPTYFINSPDKLLSEKDILHYNFHTKEEYIATNYLPAGNPARILITSGASCPDAVVESVIRKLATFYGVETKLDAVTQELAG